MNEYFGETEGQTRVRRTREALASARQTETEARKALAYAVRLTRSLKDKFEELFLAEERAEVARRKFNYCHATK